MPYLRTILLALLLLTALSGWVLSVIAMIAVGRNRRPEVTWSQTGFNYSNLLFMPSLLTDQGLRWRRLCFLGVAGFFVSCALAVAVSLLLRLR